jgi:membrane-associated phospholipid phosphatase
MEGGNVLPIFILTVVIPIISYLILRNIGVVTSIFMPSIVERRYPLLIHSCLLAVILFKVIPQHYIVEIYFYFVGLLSASLACLLLLLLRFKVSLHMAGIGALFMYLINLSIHFEKNVIIAISLFALSIGLVASSRLFLRAHSPLELFIGLSIGLLSQLLTVKFWL